MTTETLIDVVVVVNHADGMVRTSRAQITQPLLDELQSFLTEDSRVRSYDIYEIKREIVHVHKSLASDFTDENINRATETMLKGD